MSASVDSLWSALPLGRGVVLLNRDANGLGALAKPAGILAHPNTRADEPVSLLNAPYQMDGEYYQWTASGGGAPLRLWLLNRLDGPTSGVILVAASEELAKEIRAMFLHRQVRKVYNALVFGSPSAARQTWRDLIAVQKKGGKVRAVARGNIPAEADMTVLRQQRTASPPLALIRLEPRTGRSHQLRVQCAKRRLPIVGDGTYGDFTANRAFAKRTGEKRLFLHSLETAFDYDYLGKSHHFAAKAPLPEEFMKLV